MNGIRTHHLCDTGALLYQLICQANWKLVEFFVRNIPANARYEDDAMFIYVFVSFSAVRIYGLSYIHLHSSPSTGILPTNSAARSQLD